MSGVSQPSPGSSGAGNANPAAGGGPSGDGANALQQMLQQQAQQIQSFGQELAQSRQIATSSQAAAAAAQQTLDRLKGVLVGDKPEAVSKEDQEIQHYQEQIDDYIATALEHERAGRPIPVTINAAIKAFQGNIARIQEIKALKGQFETVAAKVDRMADPQNAINQQAYANLDSLSIGMINQIYGNDDAQEDTKAGIFRAVSSMMTKEIKNIMETDPQLWDRIRRNPADQQTLVRHYVKQVVPPRAMQIMEEDNVRRTPLTLKDLEQAWDQTKQIDDPNAARELRQQLRPAILEQIFARSRSQRRGDGPGVNDLFR